MKNIFTPDIDPELQPFLQTAKDIALDKSQPISVMEARLEQLLTAVVVWSKQKLLEQIEKNTQ